MNNLAKKIKDLRIAKGWTQEELASRIGVLNPSISLYEAGLRLPPLDRLVKIAEVFSMDISYFVMNDDEPVEISPRMRMLIQDLEQLSDEDLEFVKRLTTSIINSKPLTVVGG